MKRRRPKAREGRAASEQRQILTQLCWVALALPLLCSCRHADSGPDLVAGRLLPPSATLVRFTIEGDSRFVLDEGTRRFELSVPDHARLAIAMGVSKEAWSAGLEEVALDVEWQAGEERLLLARAHVHKPALPGLNEWHELTVPLDPVGGRSGAIVLRAKPSPSEASLIDQVFWTPPILRFGARPPGPNIILISIDTLRADHLGCYGYGRNTSPTVDRMAQEGVLFRHAIAPSSWTLPSHASMFTGLLPSHHDAVYAKSRMASELDTVAELLWRAGYDTAGFVGGGYVAARFGFDQGFDTYRDPGALTIVKIPFETNVDLATDWMLERRNRRFFVFLHSFQVHMPYEPIAPYDETFDPRYDGPYRSRFTQAEYLALGQNDEALPARDLEHVQALYDGEIRVMDNGMAKLLDFLKESGLAANTCVLFVSDHGEEFKEHGNMFHDHPKLYDELIHVPMIVSCPSLIEGGRIVDEQVGLVDVLPTVLDMAGLMPTGPVDGKSFYPALRSGKLDPGRSIVSEVVGSKGLIHPKTRLSERPGNGQVTALRTARYKLISSTVPGQPPTAMFDLREDPGERNDIAGQQPEIVGRLRAELTKALHGVVPRHAEQEAPTPDEAERERLRALGYLE